MINLLLPEPHHLQLGQLIVKDKAMDDAVMFPVTPRGGNKEWE